MHNQPREPQPYEDCQAKSIQEFGWTSQGMDWGWGQGIKSTTHRRVKEFGYSCHQRHLTWAKEKNWTVAQWSKVFFSDESKFCISFGNQGPRVWRKGGEAHSPSCLKSCVKFPLSVMIWGAMSSGVDPLCFWKPTSLHPFTNTFLSTSCFLLLTSFLKMLISFSSRIWQLPTLPNAPKLVKCVGVLDWPANSPDLNPIENREFMGIVKRKMWNKRPKMQMSWRPLSKKPGLPHHLSSATNWSAPCHAELRQ